MSKRTLGHPTNHGAVKHKVNLDANSERNAVFYKQEGVVNMYPKEEVYPREGGELQLEQLKARLPQYCPPRDEMGGNYMEMPMELTMACTGNITLHPGLDKQSQIDKENASAVPRQARGFAVRKPLQSLLTVRQMVRQPPPQTQSAEEKLAQLYEQMESGSVGRRERRGQGEEDNSDTISELLDNMVLQQSAEKQLEQQQRDNVSAGARGVVGAGVTVPQMVAAGNHHRHQENLEHLVNQENQPQPSLYKPHASNTSSGGCATRLNFSDAESSLGTSHLNSLMEDSVGGRGSVLGHSQVRPHEHSGMGGQSFEVFHDSMKGQTHNASYGRPDKVHPAARQSHLERKSGYEVYSLAESYQSYDQSHSYQAGVSKSNMSSFSAYEDTAADQSSFAPFHDSWANSSRDVAGGGRPESGVEQQVRGRALRPVSVQSARLEEREGEVVYHKALGVPLEGGARLGYGGMNSSVADHSFTQVGICHPKVPPSISTPVGKNIDLTFDISRIQPETELIPPQTHQQQHVAAAPTTGASQRKRSWAVTLSTIKEESSSFKSSRSSTTTTSSSSSSSSSSSGSVVHDSLASSPPQVDINPFSSEIVNMMLNAMSPSVVDSVCRVPGRLPQLCSGRTVLLGQQEFCGVKRMTSGGFGTIYSCRDKRESKVLKVQKPAMQWEMAIITELHTRLESCNLMCQCFVSAEKTFMFDDASVMVLPHYKHGSLLDLANAHGAHLSDSFLSYYTAEVLDIVDSLHQCGILHTDIKPDNFMLTDISCHKNFASAVGNGLVLIDFGRAVDLTVFPADTQFQGSSETEGFQCTQMLEGKLWKHEADYFGIAATVHVLLTGVYMSVHKDAQSNLYQPSKPLRRMNRTSLWNKFFSCLLNTAQPLPLSDMANEMRRTKLEGLKDYVFQAFFKKVFAAVQKKIGQTS